MRTYHRVKALALAALAVGLAAAPAALGNDLRALDYATEDAAYRVARQMAQASLPVSRIAFLGLFQDGSGRSGVLRAGMIRYPGAYEWYTRSEAEWDLLVAEIEFGERRMDVMDAESIQKFGRVKGVEALLYGEVQEAAVDANGGAVVRLALSLGVVETGRIVWSTNVEGRYDVPPPSPPPSPNVGLAADAAVAKLAADLLAKLTAAPPCDVYLLPLAGPAADHLGDKLLAALGAAKPAGVSLFAAPASPEDARLMKRLADDLLAGGGIDAPALGRLFAGTAADGRAPAVLVGRVERAEESGRVSVVEATVRIQRLADNQILASANARGEHRVATIGVLIAKLEELVDELVGKTGGRHLLVAAAVVVGLVLIAGVLRGMRRPR